MELQQLNLFKNLLLSEEGHTSLLYRFLNPNGTHGQNDLLLKIFVQEILKGDYSSDFTLELSKKTDKKGSIDLFIGNEDHVFVIKDKIRKAPNRANELYSYWHNGIYDSLCKKGFKKEDLFSPEFYQQDCINDNYKVVYLTLDGKMKPEGKTIKYSPVEKYLEFPQSLPCPVTCISYKEDINNWLLKTVESIEDKKNNALLVSILEEYSEWITHYS